MSRGSLFISGSLAQPAYNGGLTWFHLQLILGFRRLGWDVLFIDRLEPEMCVDISGRPATFERSVNREYFSNVMNAFGLNGVSSLIYNRGEQVVGVPLHEVRRRARGAPLLNVMGYLNDEGILAAAGRRVFVDIDPGFGQMWRELGWHDPFRGHDAFVTLGMNIGRPDCEIPTCGLQWIRISQPVVLERWPAAPSPATGAAFTGIGAWRGPNAPIEYKGKTYGLRVHEFRKFVGLPKLRPETRFEMALDIHPADEKDIRILCENGWRTVQPRTVAGGPGKYRDFIAASKAEFMVPKQMYVQTNSGLLSDRSVYYLASGRPVLARDTGIGHLYPTGEGLLTFSTLDEAAAGVEEINRNYSKHARKAREIAVEYFDSDRVLRRLLNDLEIS